MSQHAPQPIDCPRGTAPTQRQQGDGQLEDVELEQPLQRRLRSKEDREEHSTVNVPLVFHVHPSKPCSLHDCM